jgi:DMSO/TMAO reductase YedYZ molybdopterin-dependent catalytic subunit
MSTPRRHCDRRQWLRWAAATGAAAALPYGCARRADPAATNSGPADAPLRFPGKVAMRALNDSPPCLETPWSYFREDLTPNDVFYVRWHLQFIPTSVDLRTWRLKVGGHVERPLELSMDELGQMGGQSVVAVNQCSGNSRGLFEPHMPGAQWGNGAMGNARWTGVPLRELLRRAGVKDGAVDVSFAGLDRGGYPTVPDFTKSLPVQRANDPEILVAYEMNGGALPLLNGFPARLVVPGWYGTYWVKALSEITVLPQQFDGFWMSKAYRIPTTTNAIESPAQLAEKTVSINRMNVRSFFVTPEAGARLSRGQSCLLEGIAFDGGSGIKRVEVATDAGATWQETELGEDLGQYSFRRWRLSWRPDRNGPHRLAVRAVSRAGETQPAAAGWNRSGYMRNVIEELSIEVV